MKSKKLDGILFLPKKILFLTGSAVLLLFIVITLFFLYKNPFYQVNTLPLHALPTGDGSYITQTSSSGQVHFVSPKLGINFLILLNKDKNTHSEITEVGKRVYIYIPAYGSISHNRYEKILEVFNKDPKDSLQTAIQKIILQNYSPANCFVKIAQREPNPKNRIYAYIAFPLSKDALQTDPLGFKAASKCPSPYTQLNDVRIFMMDTKHPGTFFYLQIGQSDYLSGDPKYMNWEDTLQVNN